MQEGTHLLTYLSVCSGIEAATVAWHPLGWKPIGFAEIDKFPSAVLAHHYPEVKNYGDFTKIEPKDLSCHPDILVGGTPCQSFSIAGKRAGLDDPRGNLTLEFVRLAARLRTRWLVWENVPGVLSIDGGQTFGAFLGALGEVGYGVAYRILDAQYIGVPQRRRRVFVVGHFGDWRRAAAVLFERQSLSGGTPPSREKRKSAPTIPSCRTAGGGLGTDFDCDGGLIPTAFGGNNLSGPIEVATACNAHGGPSGRLDFETETFVTGCLNANGKAAGSATQQDAETGMLVTHSLRADGFDASEDGTGRGTPLVPIGYMPTRTFGKDGGIDSRYAPRDVCDALHTSSGGGNKAPLILRKERVGTSRCLNCEIEFNVYYLPGTEMLAPINCPKCGEHPGCMTYDMQHGGTAPIAFSCKDSGLDSGEISPTLRGMGHSESHANAGGQVAVAFNLRGKEGGSLPEMADQASVRAASGGSSRSYVAAVGWPEELTASEDLAGTVQRGGDGGRHEGVMPPTMQVRRLTPVECERLQEFPDNYTKISEKTADGPRYRSLGNSFAVPVVRWIGQRIQLIDLFS